MRQAIITRYIAATNHRGARIKAKAYAGEISMQWQYELSVEQNHELAAHKLLKKLEWPYDVLGGQAFNGNFVFILEYKR